jgi:hypothetical protein
MTNPLTGHCPIARQIKVYYLHISFDQTSIDWMITVNVDFFKKTFFLLAEVQN